VGFEVNRNWLVFGLLVVALAAMVVTAIRRSRSSVSTAGASLTGNVEGATAPDFALADLSTGQTVRLSSFRKKAVVLNFWATWCPPCKVEIPWFVDLQRQYAAQGLAVIGVAMDDSGRNTIARFAKDMDINYPILLGDDNVANAYGGVEALPTTFYIDRAGKVTKRVFGLASHREMEENVKRMLERGKQQVAAAAKSPQ